MALTTKQRLELATAMLSAFPRQADLKRMLYLRVGRSLDEIAGEGPTRELVVEVIQSAEAEGWTRNLVNGAIEDNPGNELLQGFYDTSWIALDTPKRSALETIIRKGVEFLDVDPWIDLLIQMSRRICRIEVETQMDVGFGTGFLLGRPDVVITNYHVLAPAIAKQLGTPGPQGRLAEPGKVKLRFDYRKLPDGSLNSGKIYALHQNWLLDWSPVSKADTSGTGTAAADELDYALVRLAAPAGDDLVPAVGRRLGAAQVGGSAGHADGAGGRGAALDPPASRCRSPEACAREQCDRQGHADAGSVSDQHPRRVVGLAVLHAEVGTCRAPSPRRPEIPGPRWSDESGHPVRRHSRADEDSRHGQASAP